jgi:hypothetical protein
MEEILGVIRSLQEETPEEYSQICHANAFVRMADVLWTPSSNQNAFSCGFLPFNRNSFQSISIAYI